MNRGRIREDPGGTLSRYLREISRFPLLDPDEERGLGRSIRAGDASALRALVEANLRFVASFAWRYRSSGAPLLDLIHDGNLGLMAAARRYDPELPNRFLSYAVFYIREAILSGIGRQAGALRLPRKPGQLLARVYSSLRKLESELQRPPSDQEIARAAGLTEEQVRWFLARLRGDMSLEAARDLEPADTTLEETVVRNSTLRALSTALAALPRRERAVISLRYGLAGNDPATLKEIGRRLKISAERVRQIEQDALEKLRRSALLDRRSAAL